MDRGVQDDLEDFSLVRDEFEITVLEDGESLETLDAPSERDLQDLVDRRSGLIWLGCLVVTILLFSKMPQGSDIEWRVYKFHDEGLHGKNLMVKLGIMYHCDLPVAHSYSQVTCNDDESIVILVSDNYAAVITPRTSSVHLELEGEKQTLLTEYSRFGTLDEARKHAHASVPPNPVDEKLKTSRAPDCRLSIAIPVLVAASVFFQL